MEKKSNHLKGETSPYLLQHLYNPVDWHPWGENALSKSRLENKPLLISIGYSACHWCHVMESESFEDNEVARIMNDHFICIKVDREERPDLDHLYLNAVQLISGRGGWPLNCFALPDGKPFWGGTYFPKEQWIQILHQISDLYSTQYDKLELQANELTSGVSDINLPVNSSSQKNKKPFPIHQFTEKILESIDFIKGGTKGEPKFPLPVLYDFLLTAHQYQNRENKALEAVFTTLDNMAMGGIYDHVGGGFARYSTDVDWKVPHFEKMLYDNGQLLSLYSKVWKVNPKPLYKQVVYETIEFLNRELTSEYGTFFSALDADSEGEEGKFYIWTEKEFAETIGEDAALAADYFCMQKEAYWESNQNILLLKETNESFANKNQLSISELVEKTTIWKAALLQARSKRTRPGLDNKVLTSWNAIAISGLTEAYKSFAEPEFLKAAEKACRFLLKHAMLPNGQLFRSLTGTKASIEGFLEDYAYFIQALINIYQTTLNEEYLLTAHELTEHVINAFPANDHNLLPFSSINAENLVAPHFEILDNVIPSSNSTMARNLFYLGNYFHNQSWIQKSKLMIQALEDQIENYPNWNANWGILLLQMQEEFLTVAITGTNALKNTHQLNRRFLPLAQLAATDQPNTKIPILQNRYIKDKNLIYACTTESCKAPVESVEDFLKLIS